MVDGQAAAYRAIGYLTQLGHRRIGLITASATLSSTAARIAGYRQALTDVGGSATEWLRIAERSHSRSAAQAAAAALLHVQRRPTAIFATDSIQTAGALDAIQAAGLSIPRDVSLIGFDDVDWMSMVRPPITVVDQPVYELGKRAAQRLIARIQGDTTEPQVYRLEATLIQRASCAPPCEPGEAVG
jgi:DNA-binding LacI/PurR family transcriptional regulator